MIRGSPTIWTSLVWTNLENSFYSQKLENDFLQVVSCHPYLFSFFFFDKLQYIIKIKKQEQISNHPYRQSLKTLGIKVERFFKDQGYSITLSFFVAFSKEHQLKIQLEVLHVKLNSSVKISTHSIKLNRVNQKLHP